METIETSLIKSLKEMESGRLYSGVKGGVSQLTSLV